MDDVTVTARWAGVQLGLLPRGIAVLLVGDSEFGPVEVLRQLDQWRWDYALRQKPFVKICLAMATEWDWRIMAVPTVPH